MGNFTHAGVTPSFGQRGPKMLPGDNPEDAVFWQRQGMEAVAPESFLELADPTLLREAYFCVRGFRAEEGRGVVPDAWPFPTDRASRNWLHVDPDLMVHRYDYAGLQLLVYESPRHNMIRVALDPGPREAWPATVDRVIYSLFERPFPVYWFPIVRSDEQARFSSNPAYSEVQSGDLNPFGLGLVGGIVEGGIYLLWPTYDLLSSWQKSGPPPLLRESLIAHWNAHHP